MKRIIAAALALTVVASMVSCKPSAPAETTEKDSTAAVVEQPVDSAAHPADSTATPVDSAAAAH